MKKNVDVNKNVKNIDALIYAYKYRIWMKNKKINNFNKNNPQSNVYRVIKCSIKNK